MLPSPNRPTLTPLGVSNFINLPVCVATPAQPRVVIVIDPATLAVRFWHTLPLPVPKPTIPPGYAITGKTAYLVTNGTLDPTPYAENTPLGELNIMATGSYQVDWGDGTSPTWNGPYGFEGLPWPNGSIGHTYDVTGNYSVIVVENWTASWTLGPATAPWPVSTPRRRSPGTTLSSCRP